MNGLAERLVQTFKQALRSMFQSSKPVKEKLTKFLVAYRNTPHSTTGESPALLLLGRPLRTCLDLVKPNLNRKMVSQKHQQGIKAANVTRLSGGSEVASGLIIKKTGPLVYEAQVAPGIIRRRQPSSPLMYKELRLILLRLAKQRWSAYHQWQPNRVHHPILLERFQRYMW